MTGLKYHFIKFPSSDVLLNQKELLSSAKTVATIPSRMTTCFSYYHTFGMTEKYLIMIEQPWVANSMKLAASKLKGSTFYECLDWCPQEKNLFHIVSKDTGKPILEGKFKLISQHSFFFLNFINCYEDGGDGIVIDLIGYDSPEILDQLFLKKLRQGKLEVKDKSKIMRFVIPLKMKEEGFEGNLVSAQNSATALLDKKNIVLTPHLVTDQQGCEHPSINRLLTGRKTDFAYVIGWMESVNRGFFANALTKVHLNTGECVAWRGDEFCHPMEAVFIPRCEDSSVETGEDDGLVVASVTDVRQDHKDFLVFLDARNMAEVARVSFDEGLPFGSHGYLGQY